MIIDIVVVSVVINLLMYINSNVNIPVHGA
jgi:hypothetical protein